MDDADEVLVLEVGGSLLGLAARDVDAVVRAAAVTPVPGAPPGMDGVVDVHGRIVPVVDAAARLGLPGTPVGAHQVFVLVRLGEGRAAVRVDGVRGLQVVGGVATAETRALARVADGVILVPGVAALVGDALAAMRLDA